MQAFATDAAGTGGDLLKVALDTAAKQLIPMSSIDATVVTN